MGIIILGLILLIVGVGGTYVYDKYSADKAARIASDEEMEKTRTEEKLRQKNLELQRRARLAEKAIKNAAKSKAVSLKKTIKPPSIKTGVYGPNSLPTETYNLEDGDISISSRMTIQELVAKLEAMKKS